MTPSLYREAIALAMLCLLPLRCMGLEDVKDMVLVPAGVYQPLLQSAQDGGDEPVQPFLLDVLPVTNAEFLAFVCQHPNWRRSRVGRLFGDGNYLSHWASDLELGPNAPADAPVAHVSWFAAKAYAEARGKRLPTTAEWERAASAGYTGNDARNDKEMMADVYRWLGVPSPKVLPGVGTARANTLGVRGLLCLVWEWVDDFNSAMVSGESRSDSSPDSRQFCGAASVGVKDTANYAAFMRLALRSSLKGSDTTPSLGFRCARSCIEPLANFKP